MKTVVLLSTIHIYSFSSFVTILPVAIQPLWMRTKLNHVCTDEVNMNESWSDSPLEPQIVCVICTLQGNISLVYLHFDKFIMIWLLCYVKTGVAIHNSHLFVFFICFHLASSNSTFVDEDKAQSCLHR